MEVVISVDSIISRSEFEDDINHSDFRIYAVNYNIRISKGI